MAEQNPIDPVQGVSQNSRASQKAKGGGARWLWLMIALLFMFLVGMLGSPLIEQKVRSQLPAFATGQERPEEAALADLRTRIEKLESQHAIVPPPVNKPLAAVGVSDELGARIAALETHAASFEARESEMLSLLETLRAEIVRVDSEANAGNAQMRDLFLLGITRRMFEAGRPLGNVGNLISNRFHASDQAAVEALLSWSAAPQTADTLRKQLDALREVETKTSGETASFWQKIRSSLSNLVTVRDASATPDAAAAFAAAQQAMEDGSISLAVAALGSAPMDARRKQWVADANLVLKADSALVRLENRALQDAIDNLAGYAPPAAGTSPVNAAPPKG